MLWRPSEGYSELECCGSDISGDCGLVRDEFALAYSIASRPLLTYLLYWMKQKVGGWLRLPTLQRLASLTRPTQSAGRVIRAWPWGQLPV